jgi:hypothetical protein
VELERDPRISDDVDLVASFDFESRLVTVMLDDPKWRYEERVRRLQDAHPVSKAEAERVVRAVIAEKEHGPGDRVTFSTRSESGRTASLSYADGDDF